MTPLELIKQGILDNDIEKVKEGYKALTGESPTEKKKKGKKKQPEPETQPVVVQQPVATPKKDEYDLNQFKVPQNREILDEKQRERPDGKKVAKKESINVEKIRLAGNLFEDKYQYATNDLAIDRKVKRTVSPRTREAPQPQVYKCQGSCGKSYLVSPLHVGDTGRYVCPQCIKELARN